ncbi:acetate--CoA ligase family protein [Lentilitoribacter sp. Alg239-R112]|uniref:acetate--CoA ligase family protein n=1 Tax=Lentilitoribacter sp. Alg239-R112 TaxID=2305987 RepID=UPI0013A6AE40|nr:acetate--CoA ligase family protein [Lentilitoribacter sp. Alg239-R112]
MSSINLKKALRPRSVVLIGASEKDGSLGKAVAKNLLKGGFDGSVWFVNPKYENLYETRCYARVEELPEIPDLAIIVTPPATVHSLVDSLGRIGCGAATIVTAGVPDKLEIAGLAKKHDVRLIGPNCLGLMTPRIGLDASFSHLMPKKGDIAFISQSGAILTSVIDWARPKDIGFSHLVSLGDAVDVSIADMLEYLGDDPETGAILIYMEAIKSSADFMKAASHAANKKPVIVIKVGLTEQSAKAVMSHTGALAGRDEVYDAAFRKCGLVRVDTLEDLFDVGELLSNHPKGKCNRPAIITNGGGLGIIAADRVLQSGMELAPPSGDLISNLDNVLPKNWSGSNPIDIIGDADSDRYRAAFRAALSDETYDSIVILNCPTSASSNVQIAKDIATDIAAHDNKKMVVTCWVGDETAQSARGIFDDAGMSTFESPEDAITALHHLSQYHDLLGDLKQSAEVKSSIALDRQDYVAQIIHNANQENRSTLSEYEAKEIVAAYGIPVTQTLVAHDLTEVRKVAERVMLQSNIDACVIKIVSEEITHKSEVGGVVLDIKTPQEAVKQATRMLDRVKKLMPDATIQGFAVQPMIKREHARELILGIAQDATFGPIIMFGAGGTAVEVMNDKVIELPPVYTLDATKMISKTRIGKLLKSYRHVPAADEEAICKAITAISQLASDFPAIAELDINPLIADVNGIIALDARIGLKN